MNIMFLLFSFTVGGTERLVADICNKLAERNYKVHLYIVNDHISSEMIQSLSPKVLLHLSSKKRTKLDKLISIFEITRYIKDNNITTIHCNSFNAPFLLIFRHIFCRKLKVVQTIHGLGQFDRTKRISLLIRNYIVDNYIAISRSVLDDMINHKIPKEKIHLIYNAIDLKKFQNTEHRKFNKENVIIGNVARLDPSIKGQDLLIESIVKLKDKYPNIKCYLAGPVDLNNKKQYEMLKKQCEENNLIDNVVFLGTVNDIHKFLNGIDIFVLPSRIEGFGISLVEALAMQVPCITSDLNGPKEIIDMTYGLLFECGNVHELTKKIVDMIENYDIHKEKTIKKSVVIRRAFDLDIMIDRLKDIYIS